MDTVLFRKNFPEFSDIARYPDSLLNFWYGVAILMVRECRWKTMFSIGVNLYVAHEITLAAQNAQAGANGGVPGTSSGLANSKAVGQVSVGYDTTSTSEKDAGWWNLTIYGEQFYRLARMFGAGVTQL